MRQIETRGPYRGFTPQPQDVPLHIHLPDRAALDAANELIIQFGEHASFEAALRAERSRDLGNAIHFCRWRAIERTILMLSLEEVTGTVH